MRIAFYAPLKPPDHPVPSGDRTMARLFLAALRRAGHDVDVASPFRSRSESGDQAALRAEGQAHGASLVSKLASDPPDLWFTYHLYHKAPDWLGPAVAAQLAIPYVVAEASFAPKQAGGPYAIGHDAVREALRSADIVFGLNPADAECVRPLLAAPDRYVALAPFLDASLYAVATPRQEGPLRMLTAAMMRSDQKRDSYLLLAEALAALSGDWTLEIVGGGPAKAEIRSAFARFGTRVAFSGILDPAALRSRYAESDLFVWPAVKEAWGMALLEAQASGLPVVAGRSGGIPDIVKDGETGVLAHEGDVLEFATAIRTLAGNRRKLVAMGAAARANILAAHDLPSAAQTLDRHLLALLATSAS
jgi:glycosyltransferase involved in cell wall biosynthesis